LSDDPGSHWASRSSRSTARRRSGEELVWRGVVQTALARRLGPWRGVPIAALAYAVAHAPLGSPVLVVVALLCGMAWGALPLDVR